MTEFDKKLIGEYLRAESQLRIQLEEKYAERLRVKDKTYDLIGIMSGAINHTNKKAVGLKRRFKESVAERETFCFIAFLYFDIKTQELADRFRINRQVVHHYCMNVISKYKIYEDYRENILEFFTHEEMEEMIQKFDNQKRNGDKKKKSTEGQGKAMRQLQ